MHRIYIGYSEQLSAREIMSYFDIDSDHPDLISKFEQRFGADYVDGRNFEIYGKEAYPDTTFDAALITRLLPFSAPPDCLASIDYPRCCSVFFIVTGVLTVRVADGLTLLEPFEIEKFDFELPQQKTASQ